MAKRVCPTPGCPTLIGPDQRTCTECARARDKARGTRQERGYDRSHFRTRAELLPQAYGQPCPHCGERMWPHQDLHLDHTDDRQGYIGIVHAACNLSRAGRSAHRE